MDKSYVSMERRVCVVCCKEYDTGALLLDKRLRDSMDKHTLTGWGMCEEHQKLKDDGYVAMVGCDASKQGDSDTIKPEEAHRTGKIAHIKKHVFNSIFNVEAPCHGVVFCDSKIIDKLQTKMN